MESEIECPKCKIQLEEAEYIEECLNSYLNIGCDCGCDFKISAVVNKVEWVVEEVNNGK